MTRPYLVTLEGRGFLIPVAGDKALGGFITIRSVLAANPEDAERKAIAALEREEDYRGLVEITARELGSCESCKVRLEGVGDLSWLRWLFSQPPRNFLFYQDDEQGA